MLQFRCPRRRGAGCSTELPRHDGGALGARAFRPASDRDTPPRSGDHSHSAADRPEAKEPAFGRRAFLAASGGSGPEGPRTQRTAIGVGGMPCCSSDARDDGVRVAVPSCLDTTEALWVRGPSGPLPTETRRREAATIATAPRIAPRQRSRPSAGAASGPLPTETRRREAATIATSWPGISPNQRLKFEPRCRRLCRFRVTNQFGGES